MDLYIYSSDLEMVGIIDAYNSLIWAKRYWDVGDCELYVPATPDIYDLCQIGRFIVRSDDDMVCQIKKIELQTDAENGNYLIVTGYDVKRWLDQRIVITTHTAKGGKAEEFARSLVYDSLGGGALPERMMQDSNGRVIFGLGDVAGLPEAISTQVTYKNVGEKIRDLCRSYGWGYRVRLDDIFLFELYAGQDKSDSVIFSDDYENLITSTYVKDESNLGNIALIAGEGEGAARTKTAAGDIYTRGVNRYEVFVDAKDISRVITYGELTALYSGGYIRDYNYTYHQVDLLIIDEAYYVYLIDKYPGGTVVTIDGNEYYRVHDVIIAHCQSNDPQDEDEVELTDVAYIPYLITRGYESLAEYGAVTSFEGTIEPNTTFAYKIDYNLGDIVTVENQYNISVNARITEVVEVFDNNGHSVEPKFEYITEEGSING